jgi:hypothetical protein
MRESEPIEFDAPRVTTRLRTGRKSSRNLSLLGGNERDSTPLPRLQKRSQAVFGEVPNVRWILE